MNKTIDDYFNDEDIEDIPDNIGQDEYLGDEFMSLAAKRILLTIKYTKSLVKYVKMVRSTLYQLGDSFLYFLFYIFSLI
jgi:hypothetical protein